ncbi:MAG: GlsB/YeaQ/YmgE family stress response membrane protein [Chloroflexi bacterium]|nr:GlsB/YeaQ/YmgE family stress response membrane protein [Chloroflexota bacterium]
MWITTQVVGILITLFLAGLIGWVADAIVPGRLPWGWLGAILAGLLGSWLGTWLFGHIGPSFFGIAIIPAILGAIILALALEVLGKLFASKGY